MLDDLRRFSTEAYPEGLRPAAWAEALGRLHLVSSHDEGLATAAPVPLAGLLSARNSALGSSFMVLRASPQTLGPAPEGGPAPPGALLMLALLEGRGELIDGSETLALRSGQIVLLDPSRPWQARLATAFRAVVARLESASFALRLVRRGGPRLNAIATAHGAGAVCLNVVRSLADELDRLPAQDLLPVEATLTELLVSCLTPEPPAEAAEDPTSVQLGHLRRVCRTLEARLGDPELDVESLAAMEGLSARYVHKLFRAGGTSFGRYLKERRLERCRIDLSNPALAHFTIAELCFRWGFNDAANFSRAFAAQYGCSPRAWRAQPPREPADEAPRQRGRPLAGQAAAPAPTTSGASAARDVPAAAGAFRAVLSDHARYAEALALAPKRAVAAGQAAGVGHADARQDGRQDGPHYYYVPVSDKTVHWGYLSRSLPPVITVRPGDVVSIETLTQHASDDPERMIDGDPGAEAVFRWTATHKAVDRRGAGPMDASVMGRGAGEGFGVHICTGPVYVDGAEPGDVLEVRILDIRPRPSCSPRHRGRIFGSNAAAWWGYQYHDLLTEPRPREVVTVYEIDDGPPQPHARAVYNFRWTPQTDPSGVRHPTIDYPGVPVDPATVERRYGVLARARVPLRPHFGVLAVAPAVHGLVDSVPPSSFGGNLDNWRAGKGSTLFLPVGVDGALFSVGDPHASQGDSEACGTAIECSLTGVFQLLLHKRRDLAGQFLGTLNHPFLETEDAWVLQGYSFADYLAELGPQAQTQVYQRSSLDLAMRDAFRKARRFLMQAHGLDEDEAISLISVGVDFGVTQVVDGNWGVHAVIPKRLFPPDA